MSLTTKGRHIVVTLALIVFAMLIFPPHLAVLWQPILPLLNLKHLLKLSRMWIDAIKSEILALEENNTWSIVALPPGKVPIGYKWIFEVKYTSSGEVERYKARLVAKVYSQHEGLDYTETFSHVAKMVTVRSVLAIAATQHCISIRWMPTMLFYMESF